MELVANQTTQSTGLIFRIGTRAVAWPAAFLIVVAHVTWGDPAFSDQALLCAGLLGAMALLACAYSQPGVLPVLGMMALKFYFAMGFPVFEAPVMMTGTGRVRLSSRAMDEALLAGVVFAICVLVALVLVQPVAIRIGERIATLFARTESYSARDTLTARLVAGMLIALSLARSFELIGSTGDLGSFSLVTNLLTGPEISLTLLWWDARETRSPFSGTLRWVAVVVLSIGGMSTGMLGSALTPWIAGMILAWTLEKRVPVLLLGASLLAVLIINPAKPVYRRLSWYTGEELSVMQRVENWRLAFEETYYSGAEIQDTAAIDATRRASVLLQVVHIFEWVPMRVPHAGAEVWLRLPLYYIPTLMWPDRPRPWDEMYKPYWLSFRLMSEAAAKKTAITLPAIGDGYWRLGWLGVVIEGVCLGAIIALFQGMSRARSLATMMMGVGYLAATGAEQHVVASFLSLPKSIAVWTSVFFLVYWLPRMMAGAPKTKLGRDPVPL